MRLVAVVAHERQAELAQASLSQALRRVLSQQLPASLALREELIVSVV
jgi:hypothetical protein